MRFASAQNRPELTELETLVNKIIAPGCALMCSLFSNTAPRARMFVSSDSHATLPSSFSLQTVSGSHVS
jgi:hypothetical protein